MIASVEHGVDLLSRQQRLLPLDTLCNRSRKCPVPALPSVSEQFPDFHRIALHEAVALSRCLLSGLGSVPEDALAIMETTKAVSILDFSVRIVTSFSMTPAKGGCKAKVENGWSYQAQYAPVSARRSG